MTIKRVVPIAVLLMLASLLAACDIGGSGDDEPYRIGVMESLTGPGETYGTVANQAKQLAVEEINAAGGIDGRMIELVVEDSKCGAQDAITAYNKLTDVDGVKIILGTSCSGAMLGAAPLAEEDGVILFLRIGDEPRHRERWRLHLQDLDERCSTGYRYRQRSMGRRYPQHCNNHRVRLTMPKESGARRLHSSRSAAARSWLKSATHPMSPTLGRS